MKALRILLVGYEYPPLGGGAGRAMQAILRQGRHWNVDYDCVTSHPDKGLFCEPLAGYDDPRIIYKIGVKKFDFSFWTRYEVIRWASYARWYIWQLLRQKSYDLIHIWSSLPSGFAVGKTGLPRIITLRGSDVPSFSNRLRIDHWFLRPYLRRFWRSGTMTANSVGLAELARQFENIPITIIPNGVDSELFPFQKHKQHTPLRLLFVGRLIDRKRFPLIAQAARELAELGVPVHLRAVGDGIRKEQYQKEYPEVDWTRRLTYETMCQEYHWADIYVSAAQHEGMSMSILEALSCGCPVACVRHEGIENLPDEWIANRPEDLASVILHVRDNYQPEMIPKPLSWHDVMGMYRETYDRILG